MLLFIIYFTVLRSAYVLQGATEISFEDNAKPAL